MAKKSKGQELKVLINDDTTFSRNEVDFLISEVDGESVMMNNNNGHYWGLNETSTTIWNILEKDCTFNEIILKLMDKYEVDEILCRNETLHIITRFLQVKIVKAIEK